MLVDGILNLLGRSIENPSTPFSDPDEWAYEMLGGGRSDSGVRVNAKTALGYASFWRGVNLISRDVAKLPIQVYRRIPGGKERATDHPAYRLVRRKPNAYMTAFTFKQTLQGHLLMRGNAYAYIFRAGDGSPLELLPLNPDSTYPVRADGVLWYVTQVNGKDRKIRAEDVLHIKGLGYDGLVGYDVLTYAKDTLGVGIGAQRFVAKFFKNGAALNVVLEHPAKLSKEAVANLRQSWAEMHEGLENAHRTAVLQEGMKANVLSIDPKNSQLNELRTFEIREVANVLGVPPHKLGDPTRTAYASLEQENQAYLDETLDGWLTAWEEEITDKLMTEAEKASDTHFCEFLRSSLLRADTPARYDAYNKALQGGWMSRDEVRSAENMNPMPGGEGAKHFVPLNMGLTGQGEEDKAEGEDLAFKREVVKQLIADGTIGDVVFNLMDGAALLSAVNIDVVPGMEEPWLPVVAAPGPLVSGDVVEDPQGDVVGGDVVDAGKEPNPMDTHPEPDEDDQQQAGQDPATIDDLARTFASASPAVRRAAMRVIEEAVRRMHKRISLHVERAAKKPDEYVDAVESLDDEHRAVFVEAVSPAIAMAAAIGLRGITASGLAGEFFRWAEASLLDVAECQPDKLSGRTAKWIETTGARAPQIFAAAACGVVSLR